jgi:hypothetical protein
LSKKRDRESADRHLDGDVWRKKALHQHFERLQRQLEIRFSIVWFRFDLPNMGKCCWDVLKFIVFIATFAAFVRIFYPVFSSKSKVSMVFSKQRSVFRYPCLPEICNGSLKVHLHHPTACVARHSFHR